MPNIILKKTFKVKPSGFQVAHEKSFSFHGSISPSIVQKVNSNLHQFKLAQGCNRPQFQLDSAGHYYAQMNHNAQKHHEEDIVVIILDTMEGFGWNFRFQYDVENHSEKLGGSSYTKKECFIFHK